MKLVAASAHDYASWRDEARALLARGVAPEQVSWGSQHAPSLFDEVRAPAGPATAFIPRAVAQLLEACACHADPGRWGLMYRLLWRVAQGERRLLEDAADADVSALNRMAKAVAREVHKMHAFVRFREVREDGGEILYTAWFEPEHRVLERAAPFFVERFASMRWIIATPDGALHWDRVSLRHTPGPLAPPPVSVDGAEALWRTYYRSVFNPARFNPRLMRQHVPLRYWKNLPEASEMARPAAQAVHAAGQAQAPRWAGRVEVNPAEALDLQACRRCPIGHRATQAVAGEGPAGAHLMIVGEQPGDEEDLAGRPFVGPAGKVLDRALAAAGVERRAVYLTNAVKHFKWEPRGKRRLHKTPAQQEIESCRAWLDDELADIRPRVILALGATAANALGAPRLSIAALRKNAWPHRSGAALHVTYHPSAVLRAQDDGDALFDAIREDLAAAERASAM